MKRHFLAVLAASAIAVAGCAGTYERSYSATYSSARGTTGVEFALYDALAPYGTWVEVGRYGWAWCPLDVSAGWRPYTVGRWAYTDNGWLWVSADPWGGIPYHYGRWDYNDDYGWIWIPGDVWAPAWVAWRYGDDWCGWAPLPPDVTWRVGVGFEYTSAAFDSRIDSYSWCFVPAGSFTTRSIAARVVPPSRNVTLLSVTTNITNYVNVGSTPVEQGMRPELLGRNVARSITKYRVVETQSPRAGRNPVFHGRDVEVFRPQLPGGPSKDDHVRIAPPERLRSRPPRAMVERQTQERQRFNDRMREERSALEREHAREMRKPPQGVTVAELRKRHEAEARAQEERERREQDAIEHRREQLQKWVAHPGDQDKDKGKNRDRGRGRGRGNRGEGEGED
jgi:hypothetical protein